jgi:hypothetical protein
VTGGDLLSCLAHFGIARVDCRGASGATVEQYRALLYQEFAPRAHASMALVQARVVRKGKPPYDLTSQNSAPPTLLFLASDRVLW